MYKIEFLAEALKEFKAFDKPVQKRIKEKLELLASDPEALRSNIKPLKGEFKNKYRLKVGSYRVIYQKEDERLLILIVRIGHRKEVYR